MDRDMKKLHYSLKYPRELTRFTIGVIVRPNYLSYIVGRSPRMYSSKWVVVLG